MAFLFKETVSRETWPALFQSIDAFDPLIRLIFDRHQLPCTRIENLTPGTNAVFRVGDKVVKVFAPVESGFYNGEFGIETEAQKHANRQGVASPMLLHQGFVDDRYLFRYIIMEWVGGQEAGRKRPLLSDEEKRCFGLQIKDITTRLNVPLAGENIPVLTIQKCMGNNRWAAFPQSLQAERNKLLQNYVLENPVYTHGDLTAENLIIGDDGETCVIDFADSRIAPPHYEWPPLVFDLFACDPVMMAACFGNYRNEAFYDRMTAAIFIHEFGAEILRHICGIKKVPAGSLADTSQVKKLIAGCLAQ